MEIEVVPDGQGGWTTWGKVVPYPSYKDRALSLMFSHRFPSLPLWNFAQFPL